MTSEEEDEEDFETVLEESLSEIVGNKKTDVDKYNQLQFQHSKAITSYASSSCCWNCFIEGYGLDRNVIKHLYTKETLFKNLNVILCNEDKSCQAMRMFTQFLSEALYQQYEKLPGVVYRGVKFSEALVKRYERNIGKTIYYYSFTSTSRSIEVAKRFADPYLMVIHLDQGKRDCVADVSTISAFRHEQEVLIACNSGFVIESVDTFRKLIVLRLVDQSRCLRERPRKSCKRHR